MASPLRIKKYLTADTLVPQLEISRYDMGTTKQILKLTEMILYLLSPWEISSQQSHMQHTKLETSCCD